MDRGMKEIKRSARRPQRKTVLSSREIHSNNSRETPVKENKERVKEEELEDNKRERPQM